MEEERKPIPIKSLISINVGNPNLLVGDPGKGKAIKIHEDYTYSIVDVEPEKYTWMNAAEEYMQYQQDVINCKIKVESSREMWSFYWLEKYFNPPTKK